MCPLNRKKVLLDKAGVARASGADGREILESPMPVQGWPWWEFARRPFLARRLQGRIGELIGRAVPAA
jgi:hypothetical protein